nr:MAG TPA: tail component [Caudoviricetes sp.]
MIQQQIYNALKPLVLGRCFYGVIPDTNKDYPVIVYQFPNISPNSALEDGDLDDYQVQIDIYSPNPDDIFSLRKQIFTALSGAFDFAERMNDFSDYEADTKLHRRVINYQIAYGE